MYDTYAASSVNFTAKADMAVSGTWVLDGEEVKTGTFEHTSEIAIPLKDLADGDHTLQIYGKNEKVTVSIRVLYLTSIRHHRP